MHAPRIVMVSAILVLATGAFARELHRPGASPILSGTNINLVDVVETGLVSAATSSDPYVYAAYGRVLVVLDVSSPGNPVRVGTAILPPGCAAIAVFGDYLYCYCQGGVQIVDVSERSSPKLEGSVVAVGFLLEIDNGRLYIKNSLASSGLQVYDLSDPTAPALLGTSVAAVGEDFAVQDGYVVSSYGGSSGGVKVFDATDPTNPVLAGSLTITNGAQDVDMAWPYAYAVNFAPATSRGLYVIDISNPAAPTQIAFSASGSFPVDNFEEIAINGNRAYVAGGTSPLSVFDISSPAAPVRLPSVVVCAGALDVTIDVSGRLAVMRSNETLCVMDCSNPSLPIPLASYEALPGVGGLAVSPTHLVMPMGEGSLALVNRDDTQDRSFFLDNREAVGATGIAVKDDYAFMTNFWFVGGTGDMTVFDISDPANPTPIGSEFWVGSFGDIKLGSNHAYLKGFSTLMSVDISNPAAPDVAGQVSIPPIFYDFAVAEPYLYVATYNDGLKVYDASNPATPTPVGAGLSEATLGGEPIRIAASGGHAFVLVTGPAAGMRVVDVGNPLLPSIVGNFALAPSSTGFSELVAHDSFVYFTVTADGLRAINVSDPTNPVEAGIIPVGDLSYIRLDSPFLYALGLGAVLKFEIDLITDVDAPAGSPFILGQNYPNPFNPSTRIAFELPKASHAVVEIFDVRGGLVRTLVNKTMGAGPHTVEWNGRDGDGSVVGSGVYFYRLTAGGRSQAKKMVILK